MPAPEGHRRKARTRRETGALPGTGPTIPTAGKRQLPLPNARSTTDNFHSAKSARRFTVSLIERSAMLAWPSRNVALPRAGLFFCPFFIDTRQAHACAGRASTKSTDSAGDRCSSRHRPDNPDSRKTAAPSAERPEHDGQLSFRKIGASFHRLPHRTFGHAGLVFPQRRPAPSGAFFLPVFIDTRMPAPEGHRRKARTRREPGALPGTGPTVPAAGKGQLPLPNARSTTDGFHSAKSARRFLETRQGANIGPCLRPAVPQRANVGQARGEEQGKRRRTP